MTSEMIQRHTARSSLLTAFLAVVLSWLHVDAPAQTATHSAKTDPNSAADLKAADAAFRAGSAAYQRNDLRTAHAEFATLVQLAPSVAAGSTAFGQVLPPS